MPAKQLKNIHFYVNGKDLGQVSVDGTEFPIMGKLSSKSGEWLIATSQTKTDIVFKNSSINGKSLMQV
jgi:hypothetical protein